MKKTGIKNYIKDRISDKAVLIVFITYVVLCLASAVYWCVNFDARSLAMSLLYVLLVPIIFLAEYMLKIKLGALYAAALMALALGGILGTCYDLYTTIPFFDLLLHGASGIIFGGLGFVIAERLFGLPNSNRAFVGCLIFAICFSLAIAVVWEIFEYGCTTLLGLDMMEDTYVNSISSYVLAGTHAQTVELNGITKTIIHYGNGQTFTINGYLDLGLLDTLEDMIICTIGTAVFAVIVALSRSKFPKINKMLLPHVWEE